MFSPYPHRDSCDRARQLASRDLDGDLSQLDSRALQAHLRECGDCAEFTSAMGGLTAKLRGGELLQPSEARPAVVAAPRRGRASRRLLSAAGVAAAAVAAASAGAFVASDAHQGAPPRAHATTIAELAPLDHQFRVIREDKLVLVLPPQRVRSPHRLGILA